MTEHPLPPGLTWMRSHPEARAWLEQLPAQRARAAAHFGLDLEAPFASSHVSWTCPARTATGQRVVLKLQYPHDECRHEAEALRRWSGLPAVRLLDAAPELHALLLEHLDPGDPLSRVGGPAAYDQLLALLPALLVEADAPFDRLEDEAARWCESIPRHFEAAGEPFEPALAEAACQALRELASSQQGRVLLHQDLHGDNVLRGAAGWRVIDPKPLVGEAAFCLAPAIRSHEFGHSREAVVARLERGAEALGLDRERVRLWALGQTVAWCFDARGAIPRHVETARWLWQAGG